MEQLAETARRTIDQETVSLFELSQTIWSHPELLFEEKVAHETLTTFLEQRGFQVDRHYKNISTAFRASWQLDEKPEDRKPLNVAFICEYDALPEIGHACGHNLIAQMGVAAAIGVKAAIEKYGHPIGKVTVLGTPAEEGGGGKIDLINAGAFDDIDVAMMCHPAPVNCTFITSLAIQFVKVTYQGKASHASAFPWEGINALDAAVQAYNNISAMRQQMKPTCRIHGVINKGGVKPNIIPDLTELEYIVRAENVQDLHVVSNKTEACFQGAAVATGCSVDVVWNSKVYADMVTNSTIANIYNKHMEGLEPDRVGKPDGPSPMGSTDMGNVSYVVPSIQPFYRIGSVFNHTKEFTAVSGSSEAQALTNNQGKALAQTAIELMINPGLFPDIKSEFEARKRK